MIGASLGSSLHARNTSLFPVAVGLLVQGQEHSMQRRPTFSGDVLAIQNKSVTSAQRNEQHPESLLGAHRTPDRSRYVDASRAAVFASLSNVKTVSDVACIRPDKPLDFVKVLHIQCIEKPPEIFAILRRSPLAHECRSQVFANIFFLAQREIESRNALEIRRLQQVDNRPIGHKDVSERLVLAHRARYRSHVINQASRPVQTYRALRRFFLHTFLPASAA